MKISSKYTDYVLCVKNISKIKAYVIDGINVDQFNKYDKKTFEKSFGCDTSVSKTGQTRT